MSLKGPYKTLGEAREAAGDSSGFEIAFVDPVDGMIWIAFGTDPIDLEEVVDRCISAFETIERRRSE